MLSQTFPSGCPAPEGSSLPHTQGVFCMVAPAACDGREGSAHSHAFPAHPLPAGTLSWGGPTGPQSPGDSSGLDLVPLLFSIRGRKFFSLWLGPGEA